MGILVHLRALLDGAATRKLSRAVLISLAVTKIEKLEKELKLVRREKAKSKRGFQLYKKETDKELAAARMLISKLEKRIAGKR